MDWGGWAYKVTKARALAYNGKANEKCRIPEAAIEEMKDGVAYGIIDVEIY